MRVFPNLWSRIRGYQSPSICSVINPMTVAGVALAITATAHAQPTSPSAATPLGHAAHTSSSPIDPAALKFRSVFERYQSFRDEKVGSWRDANDTVTRVGGWRAYLKEAQRPDASGNATPEAEPRPVPAPSGKPDPHAGHGAKK